MKNLATSPAAQEISHFLNERYHPGPLTPPPMRKFLFSKAKPIFPKVLYDDCSYEESLKKFREYIKIHGAKEEGVHQIGFHLMTQPLLNSGAAVMARHLSNTSDSSFAKQILDDQKAISRSLRFGDFEGRLHRNLKKLSAILNVFDPHLNGNMPFLIGDRFINGKTVSVLRHAVPTVEKGFHNIEIAGEYQAFLENCKANNQKVLYCALLSPQKIDEHFRLTKLGDLVQKYPNTFHFIRIPLDGPLHDINQFRTIDDYSLAIQNDLEASLYHPYPAQNSFFFSPAVRKVVSEGYVDILRYAKYWSKKIALENPKDQKRAFMMLFSVLLKSHIISNLSIDYYNNTCKDSIDRGAVHVGSDLLWDDFLTGKELQKEQPFLFRSVIAWPAFLAKTKPVLAKRLVWLQSFARFLEKAAPYQKQMASLQKEMLHLHMEHSPKLDARNWVK
jgi:hypothetical protein